MNKKIQDKLTVLTSSPGVYLMKNSAGVIIYVGKAKNLKNRVSQYFVNNSQHSLKVLKMISNIEDFEYIVTESEIESLILENNLIKQHQPKYNILLKDDKNYPYIVVDKNSAYPHFDIARRRTSNDYRYFGPFQSTKVVCEIISTLNSVFELYTCKHVFPKEFKKARPCLNYHIGKCSGICLGTVSSEEYKKRIERAISFLTGDYKKYIAQFKEMMSYYSMNLEFEKASKYRDKIRSIERLEAKQVIVLSPDINRDIIAYSTLEEDVCFSVMHIRRGKLLFQDTVFLNGVTDDLTGSFIEQYYQKSDIIPKEICVIELPRSNDLICEWLSKQRGNNVKIFEAKRGENVRLIEMCKKNALEKLAEKKSNGIKVNKLMGQISQMLGLNDMPSRIEMYDISNFGTDSTVGGMIVYQEGRFRRSDYRKFNFDEVYQQNDYKYTYEMIKRRLKHLDDRDTDFGAKPDVIFIDGGLGHLNSVYELISSRGIEVFGLVKDKSHKTRGIISVHGEVDIRTNPSVFKFFTELQDEVHRFAIKHMHDRKGKTMLKSGLMSVEGIGKGKYNDIMSKFGTIDAVRNCDIEELEKIPGISHTLALRVKKYLDGEMI